MRRWSGWERLSHCGLDTGNGRRWVGRSIRHAFVERVLSKAGMSVLGGQKPRSQRTVCGVGDEGRRVRSRVGGDWAAAVVVGFWMYGGGVGMLCKRIVSYICVCVDC